jgi:hypothetical protein
MILNASEQIENNLVFFQQYGGFYKHQVQKYLSGSERIFYQGPVLSELFSRRR